VAAKQGRTREALEGLSKDELVSQAEALGIDGARKFTRVELIDEITRASGETDRGLLGRARDLLRQVVEKGLTPSSAPTSAAPPKNGSVNGNGHETAVPPMPTVTLAEIYLAQGHVTRARAILREVVKGNGDDRRARELLEKIERREVPSGALHSGEQLPAPPKPVEKRALPDDPYERIGIEREAFAEPTAERYPDVPSMLDDAPLPARYGVDECVAMAVDPTTVYVYWEARPASVERARRALTRFEPVECTSTLRVLVVEATDQAPRVSSRDFEVIDLELGEWFVRELPAGSVVRAAIGLRAGERFLPIAHTLEVESPVASPSHAVATEIVEWTEGGTRAPTGERPATLYTPIARHEGTLGLPPLPEAPEDEVFGRGLSSAELAKRARIARARAAAREGGRAAAGPGQGASDLLAGPSSASWLANR